MLTADIHMHSTFSSDARSDMADMIASAADKGLSTICFTEHMDYGCEYPDGSFVVDTEAYYKRYLELCGKSGSSGLEVLFGVELGLQPVFASFFRSYVKEYPFDFIIGSSHFADGMDPAFPEFYQSFPTEEAANRRYFECELECAKLFPEEFDIYGHLDYALRYAPSGSAEFSYATYADVLDELLKTLIYNGKGIEINTGGYRKPFGRSNPHISILKRYRELGGEIITAGSDAHNAADVGDHFREAEALLKECGFSYYTVFRKRRAEFVAL